MTTRRTKVAVLLLAAFTALPACTVPEGISPGETEPEIEEQALPAECTELGATINGHACQHGSSGPFASVTADDNASFAGATPKLDAIHTYYTVDFEDTTAPYVGTVKFTPDNTDDHAIYVKPNVTIVVKDKNGTTLTAALSGTVSGCSYLSSYKVYALSTSTSVAPYRITFTSASSASINALLEEISPMRERWYKDQDGDTWGLPSPNKLTACTPPAGYTVKRGGDCNDLNASINPTATETAGDGIDSNCNGNDNN